MSTENIVVHARATPAQRIIAAGIIFMGLYFASTVVITLLVSILTAYFLDPLVEWFERFRVPRPTGALLALLIFSLVLTMIGVGLWDRVDDFITNWPKYREPLRSVTSAVQTRIESFEKKLKEVQPEDQTGRIRVQLPEESPVRAFVTRGLGSIYTIVLSASFVPFLVFFMLAEKRDIWHATMQLFPPDKRTKVKEALEDLSVMVRGYILGNFLVAMLLGVLSWLFFLWLGLGNAFLMGMLSGFFNLIPYLGTVLSWMPPWIVALSKYNTPGPFIGIAAVLLFMHLIAVNVLIPALVGKQVHLNALAVTIALLFWGWIWGGMGLLLGIPITAAVKVVCDHVEDWRPVGRWLST